jgi:hypothetical protein
MEEASFEEYQAFHHQASKILQSVAAFFHVPLYDVSYAMIKSWALARYPLKIVGYTFLEEPARSMVAGSLVYDGQTGKGVITFNQNMPHGRSIFTVIHELIHYICDALTGNGQDYNDLLTQRGYNSDAAFQELRADYEASLILISDEAIELGIQSGCEEWEFRRKYGVSENCLIVRLAHYIHFVLGIQYSHAFTLAGAYVKGGTPERRSFLPILINNWHDFYFFATAGNGGMWELNQVRFLYETADLEFCNSHWHQYVNNVHGAIEPTVSLNFG